VPGCDSRGRRRADAHFRALSDDPIATVPDATGRTGRTSACPSPSSAPRLLGSGIARSPSAATRARTAVLLRHRSPENVAREMFTLSRSAGGRAIFCFHDDNFLMPREEDSLERVRAIREEYDALGGGEVALIGKCRPDSVTPELMRAIRALGVIRLYVGVENASQRGADHLGRHAQQACVADALEACRQAGIFVCYNLLLFEPDATLDDVRENVAFMKKNAQHPVNFCRRALTSACRRSTPTLPRGRISAGASSASTTASRTTTPVSVPHCSAAFRQRNLDPFEGVAATWASATR
jgi:hypothetical protein